MRCRDCVDCPFNGPGPADLAGVRLERESRRLRFAGQTVALSEMQARLVDRFLRAPGTVMSRDHLIHAAYRDSPEPQHADTILNLLIGALRRKLAHLHAPLAIHPVRGAGYILREI